MTTLTRFEQAKLELAQELRRLRLNKGWTGQELAQHSEMSQPKISKIETGRIRPSVQDVERLTQALQPPETLRASLLDLASSLATDYNTWKVLLRHGLPSKQEEFLKLEHASRKIDIFQHAIIPGLLQTADYAQKAIVVGKPTAGPDEVAAAVQRRMERQERALYDEAKTLTFLITEWALKTQVGTPITMRVQLERLLNYATLPSVHIGIIPTATPLKIPPWNSFCIFDDEVVTVEGIAGETQTTDPEEIHLYLEAFREFREASRFDREAEQLIRIAAATYCSHGRSED